MRVRTFTPWVSQRRRRRHKGRAVVLVLLVLVMTLDVLEHVDRGIYTDHPRVCTRGLTRRPGSRAGFSRFGNDSHHHHCHYSSSSIRSSIRSISMEFTSNSSSLPRSAIPLLLGQITTNVTTRPPQHSPISSLPSLNRPIWKQWKHQFGMGPGVGGLASWEQEP